MDKFVQFVGNYRNLDASYGEVRSGEALLKIDLDSGILSVQVEGFLERAYKLKEVL